jgi:hypothetical protein
VKYLNASLSHISFTRHLLTIRILVVDNVEVWLCDPADEGFEDRQVTSNGAC